jgi:hypothetical protein
VAAGPTPTSARSGSSIGSSELIDAVAIRLREEFARVPEGGWAPRIHVAYERDQASLVYAIVTVDDPDVPGAWLAVMVTKLDEKWSVAGSAWATRAGVGASDLNLVVVNAYPFDPAFLGTVGPEIVRISIIDPSGARRESTIVDGAVDLSIRRAGVLIVSGEDGLRYIALFGADLFVPSSDDPAPPTGSVSVATIVTRALIDGDVEDILDRVDPGTRLPLTALGRALQEEGRPWSVTGIPVADHGVVKVPLQSDGAAFILNLTIEAGSGGRLRVKWAQLGRV